MKFEDDILWALEMAVEMLSSHGPVRDDEIDRAKRALSQFRKAHKFAKQVRAQLQVGRGPRQ